MQKRVYLWKPSTNEVMALAVTTRKFYNVALTAGWQFCTRKHYEQGLMRRRVLTGKVQLAA